MSEWGKNYNQVTKIPHWDLFGRCILICGEEGRMISKMCQLGTEQGLHLMNSQINASLSKVVPTWKGRSYTHRNSLELPLKKKRGKWNRGAERILKGRKDTMGTTPCQGCLGTLPVWWSGGPVMTTSKCFPNCDMFLRIYSSKWKMACSATVTPEKINNSTSSTTEASDFNHLIAGLFSRR